MKSRAASRLLLFAICLLLAPLASRGETKELKTGAFQVVHEFVMPASPEAVYDAATGDISGWWDHHFSEHPKKLYIEAKPGGGFWEIFDDSGDGVLHATVTAAQRGKLLRLVGPLGLAGRALDMVTTYEFLPDPAGTKLRVTCNVSGQVDDGLDKIVDAVWQHFIGEQLKTYIESGAYKKKSH